jgi:SNF family Na+-dependent transporter
MHLLEATLGQKMQRGSAGSLRGILPKLSGAGWVATLAGLIISVIYTILLGLNLYYLVISHREPWDASNYNRIISCDTADGQDTTPEEIFLYMNVTGLLDEKTC